MEKIKVIFNQATQDKTTTRRTTTMSIRKFKKIFSRVPLDIQYYLLQFIPSKRTLIERLKSVIKSEIEYLNYIHKIDGDQTDIKMDKIIYNKIDEFGNIVYISTYRNINKIEHLDYVIKHETYIFGSLKNMKTLHHSINVKSKYEIPWTTFIKYVGSRIILDKWYGRYYISTYDMRKNDMLKYKKN